MANTKSAPPWEPGDVQSNSLLPYTSVEYAKDVRRWVQATDVDPVRQGPLLAMALGGQARLILENLEDRFGENVFADGVNVNGQDITGVDVILRALIHHFPPNEEATMLMAGLEFFNFTSR